jgi:peptide/nickel transport system ATP-binding protein
LNDNKLLLKVEDLKTYFFSREGTLKAVDGVNFNITRGETLGIAGESGCGKSVTAQSILRIVPKNGRIVKGNILFNANGKEFIDLVKLDPQGAEIRNIRGKEIAMIFQEPMTSFSPVHTIGNQIMEVIILHQKTSRHEARDKALELLNRVGMPNPEQTIDAYPFNLSGGMRQRAMIAMALSCRPSLLIADEPTTAVDVTIQALVLKLIKELQRDLDMALIIITHDLAVIAELADRVLIMYLGKNVEFASAEELFYNPRHPYTKGLLASIPKLGEGSRQKRIEPISGSVPSPYEMPSGCLFHPRCSQFISGLCDKEEPPLIDVGESHTVRCFLYK